MFTSRLRMLASAGILCGALTASSVGSAFAAPAAAPGVPPTATTSTATAAGQPTTAARTKHNDPAAYEFLRRVGGQLAKFFGITTAALHQQLAKGQTLAQIATANGKTAADVEAALMSTLKTHLDRAVAAGKITSAREATIIANAPARINKVTNRNFAPVLKRIAARHHARAAQGAATATSGNVAGQ